MNVWNDNYKWHFDYVRLAWDTSFNFEKQKVGNLDRSKICLIDIDRIIDQRDFASVERYIPSVVNYILDSEQAAVLDDNFVKIFRMSQLSVQYLLFCKKYLDNTVVLLKSELAKLKEENSELKLFNEELKEHVATLVRKLKVLKKQEGSLSHKCDKCLKVFSSEYYLISHMKRRHRISENDDVSSNTDADRLQSEIKMLKEKLNSTERLIQQEQRPSSQTLETKESDYKIMELQQKFEMWKMQVDSELKLMQTQKNAEEKYEKWFENIFEKLKDTLQNSSNKETKDVDTSVPNHLSENLVGRRDSVVQTDNVVVGRVEEATMTVELVAKEPDSRSGEKVLPVIKEEITKFEEAINEKVASSFQKIESQLDAFSNKLNKIEEMRKMIQLEVAPPVNRNESIQPMIKPRTKFQQKNEQTIQSDIIVVQANPKMAHNLSNSDYKNNINKMHDLSSENEEDLEDEQKVKYETSYSPISKSKNMKQEIQKSPQESKKKEVQPKRYENTLVQQQLKRKPVEIKVQYHENTKNSTKATREVTSSEDSESSDSESSESSSDSSDTESDVPERKHFVRNEKIRSKLDNKKYSPKKRKPPEKQQPRKNVETGLSFKTSSKKSSLTKPPIEKVRKEVEVGISDRLHIIGVSPDWKGLPEKSFKKAMEIISHQATLAEKNFSNYQKVRKHILQKVSKLLEEKKVTDSKKSSQQKATSEKKASKLKNRQAVAEIHTKENRPKDKIAPSPKHQITQSPKLKASPSKMYESDTEDSVSLKDHHLGHQKVTSRQSLKKYSEVIKELKMKSSGMLSSDDNSPEPKFDVEGKHNIHVDVKSGVNEDKQGEEVQTKSALRNYPSVGSLSKKKVLFDLDSDSNVDDKPLVHHPKDGGGSTTSVGSSVLDATPRTTKNENDTQKKNEEQEIEDLSDFEF